MCLKSSDTDVTWLSHTGGKRSSPVYMLVTAGDGFVGIKPTEILTDGH